MPIIPIILSNPLSPVLWYHFKSIMIMILIQYRTRYSHFPIHSPDPQFPFYRYHTISPIMHRMSPHILSLLLPFFPWTYFSILFADILSLFTLMLVQWVTLSSLLGSLVTS